MKIGTKLPTLKGQTTQGDITLPDDYSRQWISLSPMLISHQFVQQSLSLFNPNLRVLKTSYSINRIKC